MASSPGEQAIEAALKPLEFAARGDFAHLERVRDLELAVASAAERGLALSIPRDLTAALRAVRRSRSSGRRARIWRRWSIVNWRSVA